jgi:hypothetical protein
MMVMMMMGLQSGAGRAGTSKDNEGVHRWSWRKDSPDEEREVAETLLLSVESSLVTIVQVIGACVVLLAGNALARKVRESAVEVV